MIRLRREIYLDNNATTPVSDAVRKRINTIIKHYYGNPSSLYKPARASAYILEESRQQIAAAINADPHEIIFTGSATEANNSILKSVSEYYYPAKKKIISLPIEHSSVISTLDYLQGRGILVEFCPVDSKGFADINSLRKMVDSNTFLVCCMLANNEIGAIQAIHEIARIAHSRGALLMSDCVQALGKIKIDVKDLGVDYASFSAHKIHGPKGVGALFIKEGRPFTPFIHGGHQEEGLRAGTEGLHNIAGFAAAAANIDKNLKRTNEILRLRNRFTEELIRLKSDIIINSPTENCLPNTINIAFPMINNAIFMAMLDYYGISISAGSACNTQEDTPSHVLKAIGLSDEQARQTIRCSLSTDTTWKDIRYVLKVIGDFLNNKTPPINAIMPAQLNENFLFNEDLFILDVRFWYDRKVLKGLPNAHEASFFTFHRQLKRIPREKNVLIVCQAGYNAPIVAYYLRSKRYKKVSFLLTGLVGWKLVHPNLYRKLAGQNIKRLRK